jgi:hypothetical protein
MRCREVAERGPDMKKDEEHDGNGKKALWVERKSICKTMQENAEAEIKRRVSPSLAHHPPQRVALQC